MFTKWLIHAALRDRQVSLEKGIADIANEREVLLAISFEIIEEHAADAAHFAAMLQGEVFITPFLKTWITTGIVTIAGLP